MSTILSVHARQIFDSRGNPTIEVDLRTLAIIISLCYRDQEREISFLMQAKLCCCLLIGQVSLRTAAPNKNANCCFSVSVFAQEGS